MRRDARLRKLANEAKYEQVDVVPEGLTWKPQPGFARDKTLTTLFSLGNVYKLVRVRDTGAVTYFKLRGAESACTPAETIDAEPEPLKQQRFHAGSFCWFVIDSRWFMCEIVERRDDGRNPKRIAIRSRTGWDAERRTPWPHGEDPIEFPAYPSNPMFQRLRKLSARPV